MIGMYEIFNEVNCVAHTNGLEITIYTTLAKQDIFRIGNYSDMQKPS